MSKVKKIKTIHSKIREIKKKKKESDLGKELENKIEEKELDEGFAARNSVGISSTMAPEKNLETISIQTSVIKRNEIQQEETRAYSENNSSIYNSDTLENSSEEKSYEISKPRDIIGEIKNSPSLDRNGKFQRNKITGISDSRIDNNEKTTFDDISRKEYSSEKNNKRKYLM